MGGRVLRTELRRSVAMVAALLIAAAGLFVLYASNEPDPSWMDLVVRQRAILVLFWPLALGAGAWQGIRERRSKVEELFETTPRRRWQRVLPTAGAMGIAAVAAYLIMLIGATGHLQHADGYFPRSAVPVIVVGALAMVAATWLGLGLGALLPSPLTAPILVVVGFVSLALVTNMIHPESSGAYVLFPSLRVPDLSEGKAYTGVALRTLAGRANLAQALWLVALAAAGLVLLGAARPATRLAALLPAVLGAVVAVAVTPSQLTAAWADNPDATELTCAEKPRICVPRAQAHLLDDLREPARKALSILDSRLPPAPGSVTVQIAERANDTRPSADTLLVRLELNPSNAMLTPDNLLAQMLDGAGVPMCLSLAGDEPDNVVRYVAARRAAAEWLLDRDRKQNGGGPEVALAMRALDALRALPADEQRARVAALRDAERSCAAGDRLDLLTGSRTQ